MPRIAEQLRSQGSEVDPVAVLSAEKTRMAEAQELAELLAPLLIEKLSQAFALAPAASRGRPTSADPRAPSTVPVRTDPAAPSIADFIDGMLAQERPARPSSLPASTGHQPEIHRPT